MSRLLVGLAAAAGLAGTAHAQGYRLRLDNRFQSVSFRAIAFDSIPAATAVTRPGQGLFSPDGFAVDCSSGSGFCYFFRPGSKHRGQPVTSTGEITLWGLGIEGLTVHGTGRLATDLAEGTTWPGTSPAVVLTEAYAEYAKSRVVGRLGRQLVTGRLGYQGFDGARATVRWGDTGFEVGGYGGIGLARAIALPVTSPALNPLDDFQPRDRQLMVGADLGFRRGRVDLRAEYRREVDPTPDYLVSERAAATADVRVAKRLRVSGAAEYDFANGWWGSAEVAANYLGDRHFLTAEARRYRPFFDLWTIWGAFSPVPYRSIRGSGGIQPVAGLWVRGGAERYWFDDAQTETPLVDVEDRGWRANGSASYAIDRRLTADLGLRAEFGPGASSRSIDAGVGFQASKALFLAARAGTLDRPLEFRYADARARWFQASGDLQVSPRLRFVTDLVVLAEERNRPDEAAFDLDQVRLSARVVMDLGSGADRLPPGRRPLGGVPR